MVPRTGDYPEMTHTVVAPLPRWGLKRALLVTCPLLHEQAHRLERIPDGPHGAKASTYDDPYTAREHDAYPPIAGAP